MSNIVQVDHIVIMVEELAAAMRDYTALGFNIIEGGVHSDNPTHNALIIFEDGAYIEVIALRDKTATEMSPRTIRWNRAKPGLVDFALLPRNIDQDVVEIRRRGVSVEDPQPGGRLRPDGKRLEWKTAGFEGYGLPFFCYDVTPRSLRVQEGNVRKQPNGVVGVADVTIAVNDLAASTAQYQGLLGTAPLTETTVEIEGASTVSFALGKTTLTLAQPTDSTSPLRAYLDRAGERPYQLSLFTTLADHQGLLAVEPAHGARIKLQGPLG
jgi:catechol 2,3-dioxygenase-like lactoylglutathione lyase family enzyme